MEVMTTQASTLGMCRNFCDHSMSWMLDVEYRTSDKYAISSHFHASMGTP